MNIKIGEIIKKLRKERDVTQEKLADYLGISYQAVSKWENGTALPDITLVVPLANFFGVSTDELFSLNEQITDEKIKEYEEKSRKLFNFGDMPACIDLMRKALEEYPRNYQFMITLARAIQWNNVSIVFDNDINDKKSEEVIQYYERILEDCADDNTRQQAMQILKSYKENNEEIIQLCERILDDCTNTNIRHETMQILCTAYKNTGQREKAIKIAEEMPSFSASSNWLLSDLYEGDRRISHKQGNICFCIWFAAIELTKLADLAELADNSDEKIMHWEAALKLYETIFYDGNALYYHTWIYSVCFYLARFYMQKEDTKKAMEYLLAAEKHAVANDALTEKPMYYTSIFVNKIAHSTANTLKSSKETLCEQFLKRLRSEDKYYEPLVDNPEFAALKERLEKRINYSV